MEYMGTNASRYVDVTEGAYRDNLLVASQDNLKMLEEVLEGQINK